MAGGCQRAGFGRLPDPGMFRVGWIGGRLGRAWSGLARAAPFPARKCRNTPSQAAPRTSGISMSDLAPWREVARPVILGWFRHRGMIRHTCAARRARLPCRGPRKPAGLTRPGTEQRSEHGHEPPPRNLAGIEGGGERMDRDPGRILRRDDGPPGLGLDHGGHAARGHPLRHGGGVPAGNHDHEHRAPRAGPVERARHRDEGPGRRGVRRRLPHGQQPRGGGAVRRRLPLPAGRVPQHRPGPGEPLRRRRLRGEVGGPGGGPRDDRDPRGPRQPRRNHVDARTRRHLHRAERPLREPRAPAEPRHPGRSGVPLDRADSSSARRSTGSRPGSTAWRPITQRRWWNGASPSSPSRTMPVCSRWRPRRPSTQCVRTGEAHRRWLPDPRSRRPDTDRPSRLPAPRNGDRE